MGFLPTLFRKHLKKNILQNFSKYFFAKKEYMETVFQRYYKILSQMLLFEKEGIQTFQHFEVLLGKKFKKERKSS